MLEFAFSIVLIGWLIVIGMIVSITYKKWKDFKDGDDITLD